jgi:hypothetical protein
MSQALTDLLIDVADPARLQLYRRDPEAFMQEASLTDVDMEALRNGSPSRIRLHANAVSAGEEVDEQYRQFTASRALSFNAALLEIDPMVHIDLTTNTNNCVSSPEVGLLFVDERGQLYRGAPAV